MRRCRCRCGNYSVDVSFVRGYSLQAVFCIAGTHGLPSLPRTTPLGKAGFEELLSSASLGDCWLKALGFPGNWESSWFGGMSAIRSAWMGAF